MTGRNVYNCRVTFSRLEDDNELPADVRSKTKEMLKETQNKELKKEANPRFKKERNKEIQRRLCESTLRARTREEREGVRERENKELSKQKSSFIEWFSSSSLKIFKLRGQPSEQKARLNIVKVAYLEEEGREREGEREIYTKVFDGTRFIYFFFFFLEKLDRSQIKSQAKEDAKPRIT